MKLISWNVNGIRAVLNKGFLKWFEKEGKPTLASNPEKIHSSRVKVITYQTEPRDGEQ